MTAEAASLLGLVSLSTTHKPRAEVEINAVLSRWKKLRRAVRESARLHAITDRRRLVMVTLTYVKEDGGQPCDIRQCLTHMRNWAKRRSFDLGYVWVAELQQRGALHYHILCWLPVGVRMPYPDKQGWWPHGSTNLEQAHSAVGYMTKYASKARSKLKDGATFPKGFRMHGCGGLDQGAREMRAHHMRPQWVRDLTTYEDRIRPAPGGGFFSKVTGEIWASPWRIVRVAFVPGVGTVITVRHVGEDEDGSST